MPNENPEATPQEPVTPEGVQVPEFAPSQEGSPQAEPPKEQSLSREDLAKIVREETTRVMQSTWAKGENRIQKLITEKFAALEQTKGALSLSDEQVAQAKQKIVTEAYSSAEEEPPTNQPAPASPDVDQAIQFMNAGIKSVFDEVGASVTKADPEFQDLQKAIDAAWSDPNGYPKILIAANKAATAKATRLQSNQTNAAARVVGSGQQTGGQARPEPKSSLSAWEQAYQEKP